MRGKSKTLKTNIWRVGVLMILLLLCCGFAACGSTTNNPVGKWYNEKEKCLDIRSDGSWKLEGSYGTGTWKKLDDGIFEFTDFYGDTQESEINKDDLGQYIDFGYYGDFYKGSYPTSQENDKGQEDMEISIDPFENLSYEVSGISPFCQVSINNSQCSNEVQQYVTYKMDKEVYANGDTVVVTAVLTPNTADQKYKLIATESEYSVCGQPEYITEVNGVDLTLLQSELSDAIAAEVAQASGGASLFTLQHWQAGGTHFKACDQVTAAENYLSVLKAIRFSEFDMQKMPFNKLSFTYCVDYTWENGNLNESGSGRFWVNLSAVNLIKYQDGSVKWGYASSDACDFTCSYSLKGLEDCVSTTIMNSRDNYNISKIDLLGEQSSLTSELGGEGLGTADNNPADIQISQQSKTNPQNQSSEHSHKYTTQKISADCTSDGFTKYICSCGASYNADWVSKLGHSYKDTVVAATTDSQGYTLHTCTRCGYSFKDSYTEKTPSHIDFDDLLG